MPRIDQSCVAHAIAQAAERWQSSPMNPQNGGERFPMKQPVTPPMTPPGDAGEEDEDEDEGPSGHERADGTHDADYESGHDVEGNVLRDDDARGSDD
jgi:hypothetical protein